MDIIDLLTDDHRTVEALFERFEAATNDAEKEEVSRQIVHDLSVHAAVEEQFVYPMVRMKVSDGGSDLADHSIEEHAEVKEALTDVEKNDAGSAAHTEAMQKVIASVRHHVQDEEKDMFPKLRVDTDPQTRERVGDLVDKAKAVVPTHPHPLVPGTATGQLVAGPWAAMVDKLRDAVGAGPR